MADGKFKIAFFDIDGTLMSFKIHGIPESAQRAIDEMRANGVRTVIATGRPIYCVAPEIRDNFDTFITFNGQYCYDPEGVIRDVPVDAHDNQVLVDRILAGEFHAVAYEADRYYADEVTPRMVELAEKVGQTFVKDDFTRPLRHDVYQYNFFIDEDQEAHAIRGAENIATTRWTNLFCDVIPAVGGKDYGIAAMLERYGLTKDEAIAFGDGGNDISMFEAVGTSVAMGNAGDNVKAAATYVTDDVDSDGIYNACKHFGLI